MDPWGDGFRNLDPVGALRITVFGCCGWRIWINKRGDTSSASDVREPDMLYPVVLRQVQAFKGNGSDHAPFECNPCRVGHHDLVDMEPWRGGLLFRRELLQHPERE